MIEQTYNGAVFYFREDGYFNMTKAAKAFGKDLQVFIRRDDTVEYIDALSKTVPDTELTQAFPGRHGGTWGHPKLAVFFARWLDVKFAVWCDQAIERILRDGMYIEGEEKVATGELSEDEFILRAVTLLQNKVERLKQEKEAESVRADRAEEVIDRELNHMTVRQGAARRGIHLSTQDVQWMGKVASQICANFGLDTTTAPQVKHNGWTGGTRKWSVNVYPVIALEKADPSVVPGYVPNLVEDTKRLAN